MSKKYNIENYVSKKQLKNIKKVVSKSAGNVDESYDRIENILSNCKVIGLGTNRQIFVPNKKSKFVIKVAGDSHGVEANYREFYNADLDPKRLTNSYSISDDGYILIQERVKTMDEHTMKKRKKDVRNMLSHLEDKLLLVDCKLSNFKNFGIRDNGDIVLLDHGDTLPLVEYNGGGNINLTDISSISLRCKCIKQGTQYSKNVKPCDGKLKYSENYDYFICKKCGMKTPINDAYKEFYAYARLADSNDKLSYYNEGFDLKEYAKQCNLEMHNKLKAYADDKMKDASDIDNDDIIVDGRECVIFDDYVVPKPVTFTDSILYTNLVSGSITIEEYCESMKFELCKSNDLYDDEDEIDDYEDEEDIDDFDNEDDDDDIDNIEEYDDDDIYEDFMSEDYQQDHDFYDEDASYITIENSEKYNEEDIDDFDNEDDDDDIDNIEEYDDESEEITDISNADITENNSGDDYDKFINMILNFIDDNNRSFIHSLLYATAIMPYRSTPIQRYIKINIQKFRNYVYDDNKIKFDDISDMYALNNAAKKNDKIYYSFFDKDNLYIALNEYTGKEIDCLYMDIIRYIVSVYGCNEYETVTVPINDMKDLYEQMVCLKNMNSYDEFIDRLQSCVYLISSTPDSYIIQLNITPFEYIMRYRSSDEITNLLDDHMTSIFEKYIISYGDNRIYDKSVLLYFTINEMYDYINDEYYSDETKDMYFTVIDIIKKFEKEIKNIYNILLPNGKLDLNTVDRISDFNHDYFTHSTSIYDERKWNQYYERSNYFKSNDIKEYIGYDLKKFYDAFMRMYINRIFMYLIISIDNISKDKNIDIFKMLAERIVENRFDIKVYVDDIIHDYEDIISYINDHKIMYDYKDRYICKLSNIQDLNLDIVVDTIGEITDDDAVCSFDLASFVNHRSKTMTSGKTVTFADRRSDE